MIGRDGCECDRTSQELFCRPSNVTACREGIRGSKLHGGGYVVCDTRVCGAPSCWPNNIGSRNRLSIVSNQIAYVYCLAVRRCAVMIALGRVNSFCPVSEY